MKKVVTQQRHGLTVALYATGGGLFLVLAGLYAQQEQQVELQLVPQTMRGISLISDIAQRFQPIYATSITYEAPLLEWSGDLMPAGRGDGTGTYGLTPKELSFQMPVDTKIDIDARTALEKTIDAYNRQSGGPQYKVLVSKVGLHIVPMQARDAAGNWIAAHSPLDQLITIPPQERTVEDHMEAFITAVSLANQIDYRFVTAWAKPFSMSAFFSQAAAATVNDVLTHPIQTEPGKYTRPPLGAAARFNWGTKGAVSARDALIDLFGRSETSFSWSSGCRFTQGTRKIQCELLVSGMKVAVTPVNGPPVYKQLLYDRCVKCSTPNGPTLAK
jgi:hypothetical protein